MTRKLQVIWLGIKIIGGRPGVLILYNRWSLRVTSQCSVKLLDSIEKRITKDGKNKKV
jgi:hypothetical protein